MGTPAVQVEGLGKEYVIGVAERRPSTLRDALAGFAAAPFRRLRRLSGSASEAERFWALRDVSFEVGRGEVLGIIGRNGAGKSTLLKILSRITEPTAGRARIHGRVASLLEVGTGFHPELTGRENVFLNGAILGMPKAEIARKFDEIVEFSGVAKFIDTPVKRYSSGMSVRLAFAVAAHLEPEILVVDEVLAVGDAEFQARCLGKMQSVTEGEGRTVLFVSHNMAAVGSLCDRVVHLDGGRVRGIGPPEDMVDAYLGGQGGTRLEVRWEGDAGPGNDEFRLLRLAVRSAGRMVGSALPTAADLLVDMEFRAGRADPAFCAGFDLKSGDGTFVLRTYQTDAPRGEWLPIRPGVNRWTCRVPGGLLNGGTFQVCPRLSLHNIAWIVKEDGVLRFDMVLNHGVSPLWGAMDHRARGGVVSPILPWTESAP